MTTELSMGKPPPLPPQQRALAGAQSSVFSDPRRTAVLLEHCFRLALCLLPLLLGSEVMRGIAHWILLLFTVSGMYSCRGRGILQYATPNSLVFFYSSVSLTVGAWGFAHDFVLVDSWLQIYAEWEFFHVTLSVLMSCLAVLLIVDLHRVAELPSNDRLIWGRVDGWVTLIAALPLCVFFFIPLDLAKFGGEGDLSIIPVTIVALTAVVFMNNMPMLPKWIAYLLIILVFATFSVQDKRDAIFLLFPMVYLDLIAGRIRFSVSTLLVLAGVGVLIAILVLAMSVARGYGGFGEFSNPYEALPYVWSYIVSEDFVPSVLHNIEANYFFFHSVNSAEMVTRDPSLMAYGSTIVKPLFIPFPRHWVDWKPESIISLYTAAFDPALRARGGSWPINIFSEFYWNMMYLAPIFCGFFASAAVWLHRAVLKSFRQGEHFFLVYLLFAYMHLLTVTRGSGIDQFFVFLVIGGACALACSFIRGLLLQVSFKGHGRGHVRIDH